MVLTEEQKNIAMVIAGKISGGLSVVGSSLIIRDICMRFKRKQRRSSLQRSGSTSSTISSPLPTTAWLVLSMSIGDVVSSFFAFFIGSWMIPAGDFPLSSGNQATCDAQAFIFNTFFGSSNMTNGLMALIYWLTIVKDKPERDLTSRKWKALLYGYPWLWGVGVTAASRYSVDPNNVPIVWYCYGMFAAPGTQVATISILVIAAMFILTALLILASMSSLVWYVYTNERRMDRFSAQLPGRNRDKTVQVAKQGFLYTAAFLIIMIPLLINGWMLNVTAGGDYENIPLPLGYYVFYACIFPLQGLFNFFIYFKPKIDSIRKRERTSITSSTMIALRLNSRRSSSLISSDRNEAFQGSGSGSVKIRKLPSYFSKKKTESTEGENSRPVHGSPGRIDENDEESKLEKEGDSEVDEFDESDYY